VEHVFAQMSGSMKSLHQRCVGLKRNAACLLLTNLVYNMLRFEQIKRLKSTPQCELCTDQTAGDEKRPQTSSDIPN
jgi:hypothetical protein